MKTVYVAGPINAPEVMGMVANCFKAAQLALRLSEAGLAVICVHTLAYWEILKNDGDATGLRLEQILEQDLEILRRCDAVVLVTEEYGHSKGTMLEVGRARELGLPVLTEEEAIAWAARS